MKAWIKRVMCFFGFHVYHPCYSVRQWRTAKGRHCYHEFQMECCRCGQKTKWIRLSKYNSFIDSLGKRYGWHN